MKQRVDFSDKSAQAKTLLDLGFVVVQEQTVAGRTFPKQVLTIAAPLLATVLLRERKLVGPNDQELVAHSQGHDPV